MESPITPTALRRAAYSDTLIDFITRDDTYILGALTQASEFPVTNLQRNSWLFEIQHLKHIIPRLVATQISGSIYFEYSIPRMGRRIDVLLLLNGILFVAEYKVGESTFTAEALDQVTDYALDLKNFHETSHHVVIAPILIATASNPTPSFLIQDSKSDRVLTPIGINGTELESLVRTVIAKHPGERIDPTLWASGRYQPTPTIVEAATSLYAGHHVEELSRNDAGATNLAETSGCLRKIIADSERCHYKCICFVTGVPGAGKTLVGLNIATKYFNPQESLYSVFLSGNGPLVSVLHEALARDTIRRRKLKGQKIAKKEAISEVKTFIQNVHHFRDEYLKDKRAPVEHVTLFDEAQRAWNLEQTAAFMKQKKGVSNFAQSEPNFLISCMDRHADWAVIVCLVGGGQEINTGETGITGWLQALEHDYPDWKIFAAPNLTGREYAAAKDLELLHADGRVEYESALHLAVSMRSFRAGQVSSWVKAALDGEIQKARALYHEFCSQYPIVLTRSFDAAKSWLRTQARGSERYGLVVSSQAARLKPYAIDIRPQIDPVHWFLDSKRDIRSSYYLEDVASEFQVQGLELDWVGVAWDGDFRRGVSGWEHYSFRGTKWQNIRDESRRRYQLNAYRVLLTRARQGLAIVVPNGDITDPTRSPTFYDSTYDYLKDCGLKVLDQMPVWEASHALAE